MIGLPPGTTQTFSAPTVMPRVREMYAAIASRSSGKPGVGPYFGPAFVERAFARLDDVRRRGEVGLADLQVNDVLALLLRARAPWPALRRPTRSRSGTSSREFHGGPRGREKYIAGGYDSSALETEGACAEQRGSPVSCLQWVVPSVRSSARRSAARPDSPNLAAAGQVVAVRAARLFDANAGTMTADQIVLIRGDRIADVGRAVAGAAGRARDRPRRRPRCCRA